VRTQSLEAHSADVASAFLALVRLPGIAARLAALAQQPELTPTTLARLQYLVYLHDCGKVNVGFQARQRLGAPPIGHIAPLAAILGTRNDSLVAQLAVDALNTAVLASWGDAVAPILDAILSHHGRPWPQATADGLAVAQHWRAAGGYDPIAELRTLRESADKRFPAAVSQESSPLPAQWPFVHAVAGLVQLADWLGSARWSNAGLMSSAQTWPEHELQRIGLDPAPYRSRLDRTRTFASIFERDPYPHQVASGEGTDRLVVLEAETGSGKTEAALWRFVTLFREGLVDGLYFALPTRTAAAQLHSRVERLVHRLWPLAPPPVVMAVPGYLSDETRGAMPRAEDALDQAEDDARSTPVWAAEHPKRFFAALIAVGTIDQALLAAVRVKHAHLRASCLMRHLLVVDEVHASDAYMQCLLEQLLRDHIAAGGYAMLLSATLGAECRQSLLEAAAGRRPIDAIAPTLQEAVETPYPLLSGRDGKPIAVRHAGATSSSKSVAMCTASILDDPPLIAALAVEAAVAGAKVLVVRNTVAGAVAVQRALEAMPDASPVLWRVAETATLHHGRFAREDRRLLDTAVESAIGRTRPGGGRIIVGTQTLEQSLDIDADLLITDLCPVDVLLQRLGRLHRHAIETDGQPRRRPANALRPTCVVLVPNGSLAAFLPSRRPGGLSRHGLGHMKNRSGPLRGVYLDLVVLEATRRLALEQPVWEIPEMNRVLVESALHRDALDALLGSLPDAERPAWHQHRRDVEGDTMAQRNTGSSNLLRRDRDFMEQTVDDDVHVASRLGGNDRLLEFPPDTIGPFRAPIHRITVPEWMLGSVAADAPLVCLDRTDNALAISIGARRFTYGPHGLHPRTSPS
jgi:CRISPR-associated endonuclease/helicase Cas3